MENGKEIPAKLVQLRTQLVSQGHTRHLLAETDLMTLRIHCYSIADPTREPGTHPAPAGGNRSDDATDPLLFSRYRRECASLSHQRRPHLSGTGRNRAVQYRQRWQNGPESQQAPSSCFACWLLLSVLQLWRHFSCNGSYWCRSGQVGHALESRWHGHSRKNSGTRSRKAGADRGGVF